MLKETYRREMDAVELEEEQLGRLLADMERPRRSRIHRPVRTAVLLAAAVAVLGISALALSPSLREALSGVMGSFEPYTSMVDAVSVTDNGIQVKVLSTLADENDGMVYLEVTDLKGDRLDENTSYNSAWNECTAYDARTRTALFSYRMMPQERNGDGTATITIDRFLPGVQTFEGVKLPWELVTDKKLASMVEGEHIVLEPCQTPAQLNTDLFSLSSMGFDSNGVFHVQIALSDEAALDETLNLYAYKVDNDWNTSTNEQSTLFEREGRHYFDTAYEKFKQAHFGHFQVDDLKGRINSNQVIAGNWTLTFPLEILPERTVDTDMPIQRMHLSAIHITAMTVKIEATYDEPDRPSYLGGFPVSIFLKNGTVFHLDYTDWAALYLDEDGNVVDGGGLLSGVSYPGGKDRYGAVYLWSLPQAVDPREVTAVSMGQLYLPFDGDTVGADARWLDSVP